MKKILLTTNVSSLDEHERFNLIHSFGIDSNAWQYLEIKLKHLHINILGEHKGNILDLMCKGLLDGWCWQTTESAIVFLEDFDYIARGDLKFGKHRNYWHSWICFKFNDKMFVFDPCLQILVEQYIDAKAHCNKKGKHKNKYEDWYLGFVGFICSKGNTFFGEYNQYYKEDETKLIEQITLLKDVEFRVQDFFNLEISGAILYLDPPSNKKEKFDIDKFWIKVRELIETDNLVLITAKDAPDDFKIIWESTDKQPIKLFIHETQDINTDDLIEYDF